jgi:hypothetical protein
VETALNDDLRDAPGFSELERRNRARLQAFNDYSRAQAPVEAGAELRGLEADDTERALAGTEAEALALDVEERERPLDEQTWRTLQRIVDDPPGRPALPIARERELDPDEAGVTVGDVISASDWAEISAIYAAEMRRTPFA